MWNKNKLKQGYGLIESMIGLAVLSVGILSVLSVTTKMIAGQDYIKNREIAVLLSSEGLEVLQAKLENNSAICDVYSENFAKVWNCWGDISLVDGVCDCGNNNFSLNEKYMLNFNGYEWDINVINEGSWEPLYYNCLDEFCYYSHSIIDKNSIIADYSRKIAVESVEDYDNDYYDDVMQVSSVVTWQDRGETKYVTTTGEFYSWR